MTQTDLYIVLGIEGLFSLAVLAWAFWFLITSRKK